jgi:CheY-like chemotaxis protein
MHITKFMQLRVTGMARILFVDDDPFTLETLNKSVQIFGHQAILASSGKQGLDMARSQTPDLIMLDMMLPDMDGLTILKNLRHTPSTAPIPVVVLSASPEVDFEEVSKAAGADNVLNKPVRLQALQDVIQRYVVNS